MRHTFLKKLVTLSQPQKVPAHYNVIPFLTVHDPEADVRALVCSFQLLTVSFDEFCGMQAMSYVNGVVRRLPPGKASVNR